MKKKYLNNFKTDFQPQGFNNKKINKISFPKLQDFVKVTLKVSKREDLYKEIRISTPQIFQKWNFKKFCTKVIENSLPKTKKISLKQHNV